MTAPDPRKRRLAEALHRAMLGVLRDQDRGSCLFAEDANAIATRLFVDASDLFASPPPVDPGLREPDLTSVHDDFALIQIGYDKAIREVVEPGRLAAAELREDVRLVLVAYLAGEYIEQAEVRRLVAALSHPDEDTQDPGR